jgi:hypothetical protein
MALSFATDIKPLFKESDRRSMEWRFDLWSYDVVKENADLILGRLEDGSMPCDRSWPDADVAKVRAWIEGGLQP